MLTSSQSTKFAMMSSILDLVDIVSIQTAGNANNCHSKGRKAAKTGLPSDTISLVSSYGF